MCGSGRQVGGGGKKKRRHLTNSGRVSQLCAGDRELRQQAKAFTLSPLGGSTQEPGLSFTDCIPLPFRSCLSCSEEPVYFA